jgi:hypothetical protein
LVIVGSPAFDRPAPGASLQIARRGSMAFPAVATVVLAVVARAGERSPVVSPTEPSTWIFPSSPMVCLSEKTSNNKVEYRRKSADLLCETVMQSISCTRSTSGADGGGFEPPVPFGTHAFQACTINHSVTHPVGPNRARNRARFESRLRARLRTTIAIDGTIRRVAIEFRRKIRRNPHTRR